MLAPMNAPPFDYKPFAPHDEYNHHHTAYAPMNPPWANAPPFATAFDGHHGGPQDDDDDDEHEEPQDDDVAIDDAAVKKKKTKASGKKETFVCPEVHCGKTFPRSFALRRHMRIHTGTKPYACDVDGCTQRFNTSGNLSRHKRIHSGERPYPCVFASCGKRFNTSTKLKRHMRIHFPDGQSLFHCVSHACTFACDNYKEYVHHQRQHGNPAYAPKSDENSGDAMNLVKPTAVKNKTKTKQPRVSKASKAAAAATTAALTGDYVDPRRFDPHHQHHHHHQSPTTTAASAGLSMLMKEAHRDDVNDDFRRKTLDDRPARLPFPTGAFPSESIAGASPMNLNLSTTFGAAFSRAPSAAVSQAPSYYDHASTSSFPSYLRGPSDVFGQQQHHQHHPSHHPSHHHHGHASSYFASLRPEDAGGDDEYDSSPRGAVSRHDRDGDDSEDEKYGGYAPPHAVGSDFTGEELSAVLELMKDS